MSPVGDLEEFQLVRLLGRGGMGEVFLGHDTVLDRPVAIKLIGSRTPDAASRDRFLNEARAIARLSHPNVVNIFRVGTTGDGRPFLVQELISGRTLDRLPRPLPRRQLCELAIGIARGLDTAHRRGILHRDIKPANVMVDERGTPRLLDFGLAKMTVAGPRPEAIPAHHAVTEQAVETVGNPLAASVTETRELVPEGPRPPPSRSREQSPDITRPGALIGTPRYCAPEIWRGEPATVRSDLYSFGVVLYELAAEVAPYPHDDLAELERAVLAGGARPVEEMAPTLAAPIARVIGRCLALDPSARPRSAAEVIHELEAVLVDAPAVPDGNPYRGLRPFDAEHRGLFFGRGPDISVLVDRLRTEALIVVAGDSGIGKSSVCHAGVVPAVVAGGLEDHRRWRALTIVPGRRPWDALCEVLVTETPGDRSAAELLRSSRPAQDAGVLLVIDQLEELISVADPAQAARVAELLGAIADGVPGVKALVSVRGDFLTRVAALPELGPPLTRGLHLLRVLSPADLRDAIVGPARVRGVVFETEAMVDELVAAVAGNLGALPLLQFTLAELWTARDVARGVISRRALDEVGGVEGALARRADGVILELGVEQRAAARQLLLRLITTEHTRAVRDRDELLESLDAAPALEALVRGRLVVARDTVEGVPSYELAHEALIRSWGRLRDWLDAAAGQHAVRNRLLASAAEWQRLERRAEMLWSRRQLDEAHELVDLAPLEHDFVASSRRVLRRRRLARIAAIAAIPVIVIAVWTAFRIVTARRRDQATAARVLAATVRRERAETIGADAARTRVIAFELFDAHNAQDGERRWAEARRLSAEANAAYRDAEAELEAANLIDPGAVREPLARVVASRAALAEAERDQPLLEDLLSRLRTLAPDSYARWAKSGHLALELDRPAHITLHARQVGSDAPIAGGFALSPVATRDGTRLDAELAPGSYVIVLTMPDGLTVRDPIVLGRGEALNRRLVIPAQSVVPKGFIYVPAGRFLFGSADDEAFRREFLRAPPLHPVTTNAYLVARTEVTYGDWMVYLRALSGPERKARRPLTPGGNGVDLVDGPDGFTLLLQPTNQIYRAREGEPLMYPERERRKSVHWERLPVTGISWLDAQAYTEWLDRNARVPRARPCTVEEWERATRGADGRPFPSGDSLAADQADIDDTYGKKTLAYGPDEVGSFPASDSPFGIADLAGNATEMVRGPNGMPWFKGGSWYHGPVTAHAANGTKGEAATRTVRLGFRVCADAPSAR